MSRRPYRNLWLLLWLLAMLIVLATAGGCARLATDRGIHREAQRRGFLTIVEGETLVYYPPARVDTLWWLDTLRQRDTLTLTRDRLTVRVVRDRDTLRVSGECKADTVRVHTVRTQIIKLPKGFWSQYGPGACLALGVLLCLSLLFRWGSLGGKPG